MIRVGLAIPFESNSWLGGLNYFRSLLQAILAIQDRKIHPVLFVGNRAHNAIAEALPDVEIIGTSLMDRSNLARLFRRALQKGFGSDLLMERFVKRHGIEVWSHSGTLGPHSKIASIGWIPDFQHRHYPNLFSRQEIVDRDNGLKEICSYCDTILLSSQHAKDDALSFSPQSARSLKILSFVCDPRAHLGRTNFKMLQENYGVTERYFLVPNQFWAHKNHRVILDALALIRAKGVQIQVLATGSTNDSRQPLHFTQLMEYARRLNVLASFRSLGVVPYADLVGLMRHATAVINPSLFEGWSTSVEEAKSLGKQIVLSNIPVHIEQAPERGTYFDPDNTEELANHLMQIQQNYDPVVEQTSEYRALALLPERQRNFGAIYQDIVMETLSRHGAASA